MARLDIDSAGCEPHESLADFSFLIFAKLFQCSFEKAEIFRAKSEKRQKARKSCGLQRIPDAHFAYRAVSGADPHDRRPLTVEIFRAGSENRKKARKNQGITADRGH